MIVAGSVCLPARAQNVALDLSACPNPPASDVRAVLAVELPEQLLREAEVAPPGAAIVEVRCDAERAELWLRGTETRRTVALASVPPELRARLLALSIAELARPGSAPPVSEVREAEAQPAEAASEAESELPEVAYEAELGPPANYFAWLGVEAQAAPLVGLGGSARFQASLGEWLAWSSGFSVAHASAQIDRGDLNVLSLSLRTGLAFVLRSRRASLHLGAGLRAEWRALDGEPSDDESSPASFSVWSFGPAAFAGATWQFAPPVFLALELDVERAREVRARVEGGDAKTLSPWRASAVAGAGLAW